MPSSEPAEPHPKSPTLTFLGAAGTVTGSRFLIETEGSGVMVDCGMFQGSKSLRQMNWERLPVDPTGIDAVVLTHAHLDHTGYLPALVRDGYSGPVFATPDTIALTRIILEDSARLQEEEAEYANRKGYSKHRPALPLYTSEDAEQALSMLRPLELGTEIEAAAGIEITLQGAGHILGSASVLAVLSAGRRVAFSGDLGRAYHPVLRPAEPCPEADVVLIESTYGNRVHGSDEEAVEKLGEIVKRTARRGGIVVIPAFAVDRTEVVLNALHRLRAAGSIPDIPVHVDSPMALEVLSAYRAAIARNDPQVRYDSDDGDPFDPGQLSESRTTADSIELNKLTYPAVIISASGMATGGRILHHLSQRLPDARNSVVLVGFQAEGTRGRQLADGARSVKMLGRYVRVQAEVTQLDGFSVHGGVDDLLSWLRGAGSPDVVYTVHGEAEAAEAFSERIEEELGWPAVVPSHGERVRLS